VAHQQVQERWFMNLDEQLKALLAGLGVEMEQTTDPPFDDDEQPEEESLPGTITLFQASKEHHGVFYRIDLVGCCAQLRVFLPSEDGLVKMIGYLVTPSDRSPLLGWFEQLVEHQGSPDFAMEQNTMRQHLLFAVGEMLKRLFWSGDLEEMRFPPEIVVEQLL
jgi:hypothetical protein